MKIKQTTTTSLVLDALREADDFMSSRMLMAKTKRTYSQVTAACFWLRKARCIDVVVNPDGQAWWFALPPESDQRHYEVHEVVVGITKKRGRKKGRTL
jgi:hypothetical protein